MTRVVIDTNVLVSAFLKPEGNPSEIMKKLLKAEFRTVVSTGVYNEYMRVLYKDVFGFEKAALNRLMNYVAALIFEPAHPDRVFEGSPTDDAVFLTAAIEGGADYLITGNIKHFPQKKYGKCRVVTPAEFLLHKNNY